MIVDIKEIFAECEFFKAPRNAARARRLHANIVHCAHKP